MSEHSKKNVSAIEGEHKNRKRAIRHIVQSNHTFEVEIFTFQNSRYNKTCILSIFGYLKGIVQREERYELITND